MTETNSPLDGDLISQGWIPVTERLPESGKVVSVRQDRCLPCRAWLTERNEWKFIEYQHPHHVTHWKNE